MRRVSCKVECDANYYDDDGDPENGSLSLVDGASNPQIRISRCYKGSLFTVSGLKFKGLGFRGLGLSDFANDDPISGCEVSCPNVTNGICLSCSSSSQCRLT